MRHMLKENKSSKGKSRPLPKAKGKVKARPAAKTQSKKPKARGVRNEKPPSKRYRSKAPEVSLAEPSTVPKKYRGKKSKKAKNA